MSAARDGRGLLVGTVLFLFVAVLLVGGDDDRRQATLLTPVSTAPGGGKALADALRELGLARGRLDRPWSDWVLDGPHATLAVIAPTRPIDDYEAERLFAWLEAGGRMVWVPGELVQAGFGMARQDAALAERLEVRSRTARRFPGEHRAEPAAELPTAARLALAGAPERLAGWTRAFDIDLPHTPWIVDGAGRPCAAEVEVGAGRVLVWGDAETLRNDRVAEAREAALFVRAAAVFADDAPLLVDGFGHGLAALGSVSLATWRWLTRTDSGGVALAALFVGLVWLVTRSIRSAPAVPPPPPPGRSSVEHVEALAQAYARARAHARPTRLLLEHAESRLGAVGLVARLDHLRRTRPDLAERVERVDRARRAPEQVRPDDLVTLARDLDALLAAGGPSERGAGSVGARARTPAARDR